MGFKLGQVSTGSQIHIHVQHLNFPFTHRGVLHKVRAISYVQSKAGPKPRVRSTPIHNTYVQVNNVLFTWLMIFKKLSNMAPLSPQWYPLTIPIFLSQTRAGTQRSCTQKFSKLREWFVIHSFLILILKIFFLDQNMQ